MMGLDPAAARLTVGGSADAGIEHGVNWSDALIAVVPMVLLAGWFGVTSRWVRRGSNVGRILALAGLGFPFLLAFGSCLLSGLAGVIAFGVMPAGGSSVEPYDPGSDEPSAFYEQLDRLDGAGFAALDVISAAAMGAALLIGVAAGVLLLTGPANRYFRPQPLYPVYPYGYPVPPQGWYPPPPSDG